MKKTRGILFITLLTLITLIQLVSAQYSSLYIDIGYGIERVFDFIRDFGSPVFEIILGVSSTNEFFLTKILLLFLLYIVIRSILGKSEIFGEDFRINSIIALLVSIIAIRYLANIDVIEAIILPYGTLGVAILGLIPGIIFFYFLYNSKIAGGGRKLAWIIFGVIFLALWWVRASEIGETGNIIYTGVAIAIIVVILFDKSIKAYFMGMDMKEFEKNVKNSQIVDLQRRYQEIKDLDTKEASKLRKKLRKRLYRLGAGYSS